MTSWEPDPESETWKNEGETKPWEEADGWKLEKGYQPGEIEAVRDPRISRFLGATIIGVRPTVPTTQIENAPDVVVKDRDALKLVTLLSPGQKATTEEGEGFQFSARRYMWIKVPWEDC